MNLIEAVNSPLSNTCDRWLSLLREAKKVKHELFGQYADEAAKFYDSDNSFMWSQEYATAKQGGYLSTDSFGASGLPTFRVTINPVADSVRLFGPALYHRNPNITVQPKLPPMMEPIDLGIDESDEMQAQDAQMLMQQQEMEQHREKTVGKLCEHYLNWLQLESDKKVQSRRAINDAIVKGMGILWTEVYQPPNSQIRYPRSVYMSSDDLLKDPDARYAEEVQWVARKCVHPVNLVEEKYGYEPGSLRGTMQSMASQQTKKARRDLTNGKRDSKSFDLIEYWEIYSKNGAGQFLKESDKEMFKTDFDLSVFGKYCYFAICQDLPFPLNVPPELTQAHEEFPTEETAQALAQAVAWPIPFWEDEGCNSGWPFSELSFYESTDHIWPIQLCKPVIGEIRFVNWCMSFLADKSAASCKTYLAMQQQAAKEIKEQLVGQYGPFSIIELSQITGKNINEIVTFLQSPTFDKGLFEMVMQVMERIDKGTGLTELIYGLSGRQMRSAEEARVKNENTTIRPDEMASRVEDWLSNVAMKEMEAAVWALEVEDFQPIFGQLATQVFVNSVFSDENFYERLVRNFNFRVEAGSARKPNKANKVDQLTQLGQAILPTLQAFALGGQVEPWNAFISDTADAMDLEPDRYLLHVPPQEPQTGPDPQVQQEMEQQKLDAELQGKQMDMQLKIAGIQSDLQAKQQLAQMDMAQKQAAIEQMHQKLQMDAQHAQLDLHLKAAEAQQSMQLNAAKAQQDMAIQEQKTKSDAVQSLTKQQLSIQESKAKQAAMKKAATKKNSPKKKPKK